MFALLLNSRTKFIEKAVRFYLGYLYANEDTPLLPAAVFSVIEGSLDRLRF